MKKYILLISFGLLLIQKIGYAEDTLYANSFSGNSELYTINESTGDTEIIGSIGFQVTDVAFYKSELYGITFSSFLNIDKTTGIGNEIGNLSFDGMNALAVSNNGKVFAASSSNGDLINIDVNTGNGVLVGNYGSGLTSSGDLVFDFHGNLYASVKKPSSSTDWLAKINTETGEATLIGDTGFINIYGLSFINNVLYGTTFSGELIRINQKTGGGSEIDSSQILYGGLTTYSEVCFGAGTVAPNLDIHMPSLIYNPLLGGSQNIWADLEYKGTSSEGQHIWGLKDFGVNQ